MKIFRYTLGIVEFQQVQPLWPGRVLSVGANRYNTFGSELLRSDYGIDMWCTAGEPAELERARAAGGNNGKAPILGVWVVGTGRTLPPELVAADPLFHGTVDMRDAQMGAWHVWTAVVGIEADVPAPLGAVSSVDELAAKIRARHAGRAAGNG